MVVTSKCEIDSTRSSAGIVSKCNSMGPYAAETGVVTHLEMEVARKPTDGTKVASRFLLLAKLCRSYGGRGIASKVSPANSRAAVIRKRETLVRLVRWSTYYERKYTADASSMAYQSELTEYQS